MEQRADVVVFVRRRFDVLRWQLYEGGDDRDRGRRRQTDDGTTRRGGGDCVDSVLARSRYEIAACNRCSLSPLCGCNSRGREKERDNAFIIHFS